MSDCEIDDYDEDLYTDSLYALYDFAKKPYGNAKEFVQCVDRMRRALDQQYSETIYNLFDILFETGAYDYVKEYITFHPHLIKMESLLTTIHRTDWKCLKWLLENYVISVDSLNAEEMEKIIKMFLHRDHKQIKEMLEVFGKDNMIEWSKGIVLNRSTLQAHIDAFEEHLGPKSAAKC